MYRKMKDSHLKKMKYFTNEYIYYHGFILFNVIRFVFKDNTLCLRIISRIIDVDGQDLSPKDFNLESKG